jgi:hypothetical protein
MQTLPRRRRRRRPDTRPLVLAAAAATAVTGGAALRARRRRGRVSVDDHDAVVSSPPGEELPTEAVERTWRCPCGQEYRVQGVDRHRVYWLSDAAIADPVLSLECPNCGRTLPREHEHA